MQTDFRLEGYFISTYWRYELVWIWHVDMEENVRSKHWWNYTKYAVL
jgi:hypothetical protein